MAQQPCLLAIPQTFMNESGKALRAICQFYKIKPESILVAHDEIDFPAGTVRLKKGGGHGGHNGLRDIINQLGSANFLRLRIGVGHPQIKEKVSPYVLSKPTPSEHVLIDNCLGDAINVLDLLAAGQLEPAFHQLHSDIK